MAKRKSYRRHIPRKANGQFKKVKRSVFRRSRRRRSRKFVKAY